MKTAKQSLVEHFEIEGWEINKVYDTDLEWWADEIWELKSRWSPEGVPAFITFLVDPQSEGERKKGQDVWGIGSSAKFPADRNEAESNGTIGFCSSFEIEIKGFLGKIETLRSGAINDIGL